MEIEQKAFDLKGHVKFCEENPKHAGFMNEFAGSVGREVAKCKIETKLKCRPHKFDDGEMGEVADKLIIEIDFSETTIQPHQDFESDFGSACADAIADNVNGLFENADQ